MLRTFKVRSKLFLVLALPLVALVAFASLGVRDRLDVAAAASRNTDLVALAASQARLSDELRREQLWSAAVVSSKGALGSEQLGIQRTSTDAATTALRTLAGGGAADELRAERDAALSALDGIASARALVDGNGAADVIVARYNQIVAGVAGVSRAVTALAADPDVIRSMQTLQALGSMEDSVAALATSITRVVLAGQGTVAERTALQFQFDRVATEEARFEQVADDGLRSAYQDRRQTPEVRGFDQALLQFRQVGTGNTVDASQFLAATGSRLDAIEATMDQVYAAVLLHVDGVQTEATSQARRFALTAGISTLLAIVLAGAVARSITKPLGSLTGAANDLSQHRLPQLLAQLESPDADAAAFALQPIEVRSGDEIGQLAQAFNRLQQATSTVANEQASLLRKGIGDIFVNLARRNQSLLDRQIEFIDQLEAKEEDPDQLENLFKLDHLATRMRRNAESLLVLAGAEPPRRRGRPVDMADVVRVAVGEVEQFSRINLLALDDATVGGNVATDLAHLLSELMENATQFSPPDTVVEIVGHLARDGSYVLSVSDKGIGMSAEQLAEANARIAHPPVLGLAFSRSLGFTVIGRLAQRLGLTVRLTASLVGGVSALVSIPAAVVSPGGSEVSAAAPSDGGLHPIEGAEPRPALTLAPSPSPADERASEPLSTPLSTWDPDVLGRRRPATLTPPEHAPLVRGPLRPAWPSGPPAEVPVVRPAVPAAPPETPVAETPVAGPLEVDLPAAAPVDARDATPASPSVSPPAALPAGVESWLVPPPPPPAPSLPRRGVATPAGMPGGPPMPTRNPGTTGGSLTRRTPGTVEPSMHHGSRPTAQASSRSPEEVRQMLSRYRSGLARGREIDNDESAGPAGEED